MSLHQSQLVSSTVTPQVEMTDWQLVEGHQSWASSVPGAQVMVRPHPQVHLLLRAMAETSPLGCHAAISMEMTRQAGLDSRLHLYGQRFSEGTSLPNNARTQVVIASISNPNRDPHTFFRPIRQSNLLRRGIDTPVRSVGNNGEMLA